MEKQLIIILVFSPCLMFLLFDFPPLVSCQPDSELPVYNFSSFNKYSFPRGFVFGASTSAYQYEGAAFEDGKGWSIWDNFTHEQPWKVVDHSTGDVALDSYHRYNEDIEVLDSMGMDGYRMSISWSRILPQGTILKGGKNQQGIQHYRKLFQELEAKGITPFVTMFHWDLPQALEDEYLGFLSPQIVKDYVEYAEVLFEEFGDQVKYWITFNEPYTFTINGYVTGGMAPGRCSPWLTDFNCTHGDSAVEPYLVAHHIHLAHAAAVKLYREKYQEKQKGEIGITHYSMWKIPLTQSIEDREATQRDLEFNPGWFVNPIVYGDYPEVMSRIVGVRLPKFTKEESDMLKGSFDFIGINYYSSVYISNRVVPANPSEETYLTDANVYTTTTRNGQPIGVVATGADWVHVYPRGLRDLLIYIKEKYGNPKIFITENGISEKNDPSITLDNALKDSWRINYHFSHLDYLRVAIREGSNVHGYFVWTLLDDMEWNSGYTERLGIGYIDFKDNLKRYMKHSHRWFTNFLKPAPIPGPMPEPMPIPEHGPKPMPIPGPRPEPVAALRPNPQLGLFASLPIPELGPGPEPMPIPGDGPEPMPIPGHGPKPMPIPEHGPEPMPIPGHGPKPMPIPGHGPKPVADLSPNPRPDSFAALPIPQHGPGPKPMPIPGPEPMPIPAWHGPEPVPIPGHGPEPVLTLSPNPRLGSFAAVPIPKHGPMPEPMPIPGPEPMPIPGWHGPEPVPIPGHGPEPVAALSPNPRLGSFAAVPIPKPGPRPEPMPIPTWHGPEPVPIPGHGPEPVATLSPNPRLGSFEVVPKPKPGPGPEPMPIPGPEPMPIPGDGPEPMPIPARHWPEPVPIPGHGPEPVAILSPNPRLGSFAALHIPEPGPGPKPMPIPGPEPMPIPGDGPKPVPITWHVPEPIPWHVSEPVATLSPNPRLGSFAALTILEPGTEPMPIPGPEPMPIPGPQPMPIPGHGFEPVAAQSPNPRLGSFAALPIPEPGPGPKPMPIPGHGPEPVAVLIPNPRLGSFAALLIPESGPGPEPMPIPGHGPEPMSCPSSCPCSCPR